MKQTPLVILAVAVVALCGRTALAAPEAHDGSLPDSNIRYIGRWDRKGAKAFQSYWSTTYFRTAFTGTTVKAKVSGGEMAFIDGQRVKPVAWAGGINLTPEPLSAGRHTLLLASAGQNEELIFKGLILEPGATTLPVPERPLIEFVGDSITACAGKDGTGDENYAWEAAESLNADHVRVAFSGVALATGYGFFGDKTGMDQWYFKLKNCNHTTDQMPWDWSYEPRMVVINLGTNDAKDGQRPTDAEFAVTYANFIRAIRAHGPKAEIVALRPFGGFQAGGIRQAVDAIAATDKRVHYVDTEGWLDKDDFVDGIHPSVEGHAKAACQLAAALKPFLVSRASLAERILHDERLDKVQAMALQLLTGFSAGNSYGEIWVRDFNTFINGSLRVLSPMDVREKLLLFFKIQGQDGNVPDGAIKSDQANVGYQYRYSDLAPGWAAHKNTVETDQESSLIQAVSKYVAATGDRSILAEKVGGITVLDRMEGALNYVRKNRWSNRYSLVTGATTIDWGDVQPETGWGVAINDQTKWAIDIYDNAMFLMAINDFIALAPKDHHSETDWKKTATALKKNVRKYLWDAGAEKYIPHLYLNGSPFPADFNEKEILYTGGTACAILAGLNDLKEIEEINRQFLVAAAKEPHATIGMTVYPPYPHSVYPNMAPYNYQNAGDWTWFGGRMIQALTANGLAEPAYQELSPMLDRVLKNHGFFEWYDVKTGKPSGSANFRGSAGVLFDAIEQLRAWAKIHARSGGSHA